MIIWTIIYKGDGIIIKESSLDFIDEYYSDLLGTDLIIDCKDFNRNTVTKKGFITAEGMDILLPEFLYDIKHGVLTINSVIDNYYDDEKHTFEIELKNIRRVYTDCYKIIFLMKNDDIHDIYYDRYKGITYVSVKSTTIEDMMKKVIIDELRDRQELLAEEYFETDFDKR